jgi:hypothetical protein
MSANDPKRTLTRKRGVARQLIQRLLILTNGNVAALPKILKYPK